MNPRAIKKRARYFHYAAFSPRIGVCVLLPAPNYAAAVALVDDAGIDYYGRMPRCDFDRPGYTCLFLWQKRIYNRPNRFLSSLSRATRENGIKIGKGR